MANDERTELDGRLRNGIDALRDTPTGVPTEELIRRTIEKARSSARDEGTLSLRRSWRMKMVKRFSMAAGFGVLVTGGALWLVWGRGAQVAFSDVVEQMKQVRAVRCKLVADIAVGSDKTVTEDMLMVDPGWIVAEVPGSHVRVIASGKQGKTLMLMDMGKEKQAMMMDSVNVPPGQQVPSLLDQFKDIHDPQSKPLGEKVIDGVRTKGFDIVRGPLDMEVWADVKTDRPVLVVMNMSSQVMKGMRYTMSEFDWNPTYQDSDLSLEVPAGYQLTTTTVDRSAPKEEDVVGMLKKYAELNGDQYPASLGKKDLMTMVTTWAKAHPPKAGGSGMSQQMMDQMMPLGRGWAYMGMASKGSEWTYAGAAVKAGEKGRIVLWYKMPSGTWRAFDGDLSVHDVTKDQLPEGAPVVLDFMSGIGTPPKIVPGM